MNWLVTNLIGAPLLPPLNLILLSLAGLLLLRYRPALGRALLVISLVLLTALSMPVVADRLLALLEPYPALNPGRLSGAQAIVILGAGTYFDAPEYGGQDTINHFALERLRYGARLARITGLPILVTGGSPAGGEPEAQLMQAALEQDFRMPVGWIESRSSTTWNNARNSQTILNAAHVRRIVLVTHAWHMPRAVYAFEQAGFNVTPAPTRFSLAKTIRPMDFIPQTRGLQNSYFAMHEAIGLIWYRLKAWNQS